MINLLFAAAALAARPVNIHPVPRPQPVIRAVNIHPVPRPSPFVIQATNGHATIAIRIPIGR